MYMMAPDCSSRTTAMAASTLSEMVMPSSGASMSATVGGASPGPPAGCRGRVDGGFYVSLIFVSYDRAARTVQD